MTPDIIQLEWLHEKEFIPEDMRTNIFLATFTTCWARLKLYSVLEQVQERCLYMDTDSCVYVSRPNAPDPPLGDYLGDLTSELECKDVGCKSEDCPGHSIVEFCSSGPKSYAYRVDNGHEVCKVKGITLNYTNSQLINFQAIKDIVTGPNPAAKIVTSNPSKITRNKRRRLIYNRPEDKTYQMVFTKRVIQPDLNTLPYGY